MSPIDLIYTQSNLSDYETCARRFALRYLERMSWPAIETAPVHEAERRIQLGSDFHRLIHQHLLGMPEQKLGAMAGELAAQNHSPELTTYWHNYLQDRPEFLGERGLQLYPEITLTATLAGRRLAAKYDLLAVIPGDPPHLAIVDWKTIAQRPSGQTLRARPQSRVYPLVLSLAGAPFNAGQPPVPEQISMTYWFAAHPGQPEQFAYDAARLESDRRHLLALIEEIESRDQFPLTDDEAACRFCVFRSYCDRGKLPGLVDELDDFEAFDELLIDWEQIGEIAY